MRAGSMSHTSLKGRKFGRFSDTSVKLFRFMTLALLPFQALAQVGIGPTPDSRPVQGKVEVSGSDLHLEFSGRENWKYQVNQSGNKITLQIPPLEDALVPQIKTIDLPWLKSVTVSDGIDQSALVTFELKDSGVKYFDYLTDDPSRLVIDIYSEEKKPSKKVTRKSKLQNVESRFNGTVKDGKRNRDQARSKLEPSGFGEEPAGISDAGDPGLKRFSVTDYEVNPKALIAARRNIYLKFPACEIELSHYKKMKALNPVYEIEPEETDENKQARLLLTLFNRKRFGTFQHTLKLFRDQFPDSKYDQLLSYIDAEIDEKKWHESGEPADFEIVATKYGLLMDRYPQSPLGARTMMLMGYLYLEKGQHLKAISMFQRFIDQNTKSTEVPRAKVEIARAFIGMRKMDDAREILSSVYKDYPNTKESVEAHFLRGDTYFLENRYDEAVAAYN
ncbi:MAG: tetratricopeptide repeat protein, partial [Bdellovibrionales bacterium]|nr:tetratricopeptide repeat protein [Bdellovibrionales bacterium]